MRYHQTKLASAVFTYGLHDKLNEAGKSQIKSIGAHPGVARTNLFKERNSLITDMLVNVF